MTATPDTHTYPPSTPGAALISSGTLRALSDADPAGQLWALAMANTLLDANQAAHHARSAGADQLGPRVLKRIRNHYHGARHSR